MSDWEFEEGEVIEDHNGYWWHVTKRLVDVDSDNYRRYYTLQDATHTEVRRCWHAGDIEGLGDLDGGYERTGIVCSGKPAAKHGYRVNGRLCGPSRVDHYRGKQCKHDHECPTCGADGYTDIDVIVDHAEGVTRYVCRKCDREVTKGE